MTPTYTITANNTDITGKIATRLLSLQLTDASGFESDTCMLTLDNGEPHFSPPSTGATLDISLGYKGSGTSYIGQYVVDEISFNGPPHTMIITAKAANFKASLKETKSRNWDNATIETLVNQIAGEHKFTPSVSEALASIALPHLDQTSESDLNLLTRIAKEHGAVAKPIANHLLFVPRGEAKTSSGKTLPMTTLLAENILTYRLTLSDRSKYKSVKARWHSNNEAKEKYIAVGEGSPTFEVRQVSADEASAQKAAQSKYNDLQRGTQQLTLSTIGNTNLIAEGKLEVVGLPSPVENAWTITKVVHQLSSDGFKTQVTAERK